MVVEAKRLNSFEDNEIAENSSESSKAEAAANVLAGLRKRQKNSLTNGFNSLEILRENVQPFFNSELNKFMKDFMEKFFQPAIKNIKENTDETISEIQTHVICRNLLDSAKSQIYESDTKNVTEANDSTCNSLLHQALKRKRTDSENESLLKRQFFLTTASKPNYFNNQSQPVYNKPSLLSSLTSPPKAMNTRPVFHLITNRNLKSTHAELVSLLNTNHPSASTSMAQIKQESQIKIEATQDVKIKSEVEDI